MNNGFPLVPLGEVLIKSKEQVEIDPYHQYKQVTIKLWGQGVVLRDEVDGSSIAGVKRFVVRPQQFVLSRIDARNGAFGLVPDFLDGAVVSNDFPTFKPDPSRVLPAFLGWMSKTRGFVDLCRAASEGTTNRVRLKESLFMTMKIPLPPLPEQRRIVARIEEVAARIEEARGLKQFTRSATDTFWKPLSRIARDNNYPERTLGEMADFLDGRRIPLSKREREERNGPYPYYGASGIIDYLDEYIFDEKLLLLSEDGANLLRRSTPIAFVATGQYWVNNHAHVLRPKQGVANIGFLEYALSDFDVSVFNFASAQAKLNQKNARKISFSLPPLREQESLVKHLDSLRAKSDSLKQLQAETTTELDALLPSVLDRAFKGKL